MYVLAATLSSVDDLCKQFGPRSGQRFVFDILDTLSCICKTDSSKFINSLLLLFCRLLFGFLNDNLDPDQVISSDFCRLLITYANSLDPDQDRLQVRIACKKYLILMGKIINFLMTTIK